MEASVLNFRYFILGLLAEQPMSGYDIKLFLKSLDWLIASPSFGSVYPTLHSLLEDALVTVDVVENDDKPARKVYTITEAGRQALRAWIGQPLECDISLKTFLMRLMLAGNLSRDELVTYLQKRRSQVKVHLDALEKIAGEHDEAVGLGKRLAFDFGLTAATTEIHWLTQTLEGLS
ncbi:MAG TPA: PadR family transcriptional regulator [Chloroflexi bacterium]|nr:PadR family transcriptional regulator [Chloroflexota bacterium]